jgi:hypothetical protein
MDKCQIILSVEQCKDLLRLIGKKLCVKADLISTRLLSEDDKQDMLRGDLPIEALECAVKCWMDAGMPDYAHGKTDPMKKNF